MLSTVDRNSPQLAPISQFGLARETILSGETLKAVRILEASISKHGLLSPLIVMKQGSHLIVLNGKKRLAAIRRLAFRGELPAMFQTIPYRLIDDPLAQTSQTPRMAYNKSVYASVMSCFHDGLKPADIAPKVGLSEQCVKDIVSLSHLDASLRERVFDRSLTFAQAQAFALIPNPAIQKRLFARLGPDACPETIQACVHKLRDHSTLSRVAA